MFEKSGVLERIFFEEIIFIRKEQKYIIFYLINQKQYSLRGSLKELILQIKNCPFLCVNRGCYVNLQYIKKVDNHTVTLLDGREFPISRGRVEEVRSLVKSLWLP